MTLNGHSKDVRQNLWMALRHLKHKNQDRTIWIDALCINQEDITGEMSRQIPHLGRIYSEVSRVVVWMEVVPVARNDLECMMVEYLKIVKSQQPVRRTSTSTCLQKSKRIKRIGHLAANIRLQAQEERLSRSSGVRENLASPEPKDTLMLSRISDGITKAKNSISLSASPVISRFSATNFERNHMNIFDTLLSKTGTGDGAWRHLVTTCVKLKGWFACSTSPNPPAVALGAFRVKPSVFEERQAYITRDQVAKKKLVVADLFPTAHPTFIAQVTINLSPTPTPTRLWISNDNKYSLYSLLLLEASRENVHISGTTYMLAKSLWLLESSRENIQKPSTKYMLRCLSFLPASQHDTKNPRTNNKADVAKASMAYVNSSF